MSAPKTFQGVMLSSTIADLKGHRQKAEDALKRAEFMPVFMEYSGARPDRDVIDASLHMVTTAAYFVLIISHKYGQIPECPYRNASALSITELEYDEALKLGRPTVVFIMSDDHPVTKNDVESDPAKQLKLQAFIEKAKRNGDKRVHRVYEKFDSVEDFASRIASATAWLRAAHTEGSPGQTLAAKPKNARTQIVEELQVAPRTLFGRDAERSILKKAVDSCAPDNDPAQKTDFVIFHSFGGAGKTTLLRRLVHDLKSAFTPFETVIGWSAFLQGTLDNAHSNAKDFIDEAIAFLDPAATIPDFERESGRKLAELMRRIPTLLLLDGIEPLQHQPLVNEGILKDPALAALIKSLSLGHPGLVVITSRQPLPELAGQAAPAVVNHPLERLTAADGADMLQSLGCYGTSDALEAAVRDVLGHALSLSLLGTYIAEVKGGDITKRDHFHLTDLTDPGDDADPTARYARRTAAILKGYLQRFEEEEKRNPTLGGVERTLLSITGLFDRPAEGSAVRLLLDGAPIPGLTDSVHALPADERHDRIAQAARRLRKLGLLTDKNANDTDALDAHPIIRNHFAKQLKAEAPAAFNVAHDRLQNAN